MKVAACGKWFDYLNMMPLQEGLILERLVEEYSDTEVFQNFENISVDTDLICLDADHTNYSILIQLAKKGVNVLCQGLWNVENYLDVIREFKRNNKFVIEDESFLNFEKVSIFVDIAKKLLAFDPAAEIEIKTNCFNIYAAVRILGMFLPNMQQMTVALLFSLILLISSTNSKNISSIIQASNNSSTTSQEICNLPPISVI